MPGAFLSMPIQHIKWEKDEIVLLTSGYLAMIRYGIIIGILSIPSCSYPHSTPQTHPLPPLSVPTPHTYPSHPHPLLALSRPFNQPLTTQRTSPFTAPYQTPFTFLPPSFLIFPLSSPFFPLRLPSPTLKSPTPGCIHRCAWLRVEQYETFLTLGLRLRMKLGLTLMLIFTPRLVLMLDLS